MNSELIEDSPEKTNSDEENYRECAILMLSVLQPAIAHVMAARNPDIGYAQIMFALGLEDRSMRHVAASLNVDVACISTGAKKFIKTCNLPTPDCMKSETASKVYSESRKGRLKA